MNSKRSSRINNKNNIAFKHFEDAEFMYLQSRSHIHQNVLFNINYINMTEPQLLSA